MSDLKEKAAAIEARYTAERQRASDAAYQLGYESYDPDARVVDHEYPFEDGWLLDYYASGLWQACRDLKADPADVFDEDDTSIIDERLAAAPLRTTRTKMKFRIPPRK